MTSAVAAIAIIVTGYRLEHTQQLPSFTKASINSAPYEVASYLDRMTWRHGDEITLTGYNCRLDNFIGRRQDETESESEREREGRRRDFRIVCTNVLQTQEE